MITHKSYSQLTSIENLFQAWSEFRKGKRKRKDVQKFERNLEDNLFELHYRLKTRTYKHGNYQAFYVHDPKKRHIHKAEIQDRVVHHLLYKFLYDLFDKSFIFDSYSCRLAKGTHKAVKRLEKFTRIVSKNYTKPCWILKLDIKKFFANVNHGALIEILKKRVTDIGILWLLKEVIQSFSSGIPLGNLTSQVFANIYMNELDQFIKHKLKVKYYLRYADDFIFISENRKVLEEFIAKIKTFLNDRLKLCLHPNKIVFRQLSWGIDFLGYIVLPHYRLPKTKTKRRIFKKLKEKIYSDNFNQSLHSYLGYLSHANSFKVAEELKNQAWFMLN